MSIFERTIPDSFSSGTFQVVTEYNTGSEIWFDSTNPSTTKNNIENWNIQIERVLKATLILTTGMIITILNIGLWIIILFKRYKLCSASFHLLLSLEEYSTDEFSKHILFCLFIHETDSYICKSCQIFFVMV